ncbi:hypothetical protein AMTR_s00016p00081610 [Amborella trichopoda]|uniref:CRAL-TRIO domain-containing protein n=2 Tax=Amborella trichopoda TaxID=13333 RepID=W1PER9_AMBTC|nr:hypothetical protein AMTR_s00016p00081610 [Amborella trichopoda]
MENYIGDSETSDKRDEMEKNKVGLLRALVEAQDPTAKDVDNLMLRRFLRARDLDVKKASMMFLKYLKWRRAMTPNGYISEADIQNELAQEKLYMQGRDKKGCPIGVIFPSKHKCCQRDLDELKKFVVYSLDKLCASIPEGQEKFVIIEDLKGWGYANFDIRAYVAALNIMQDCYPERLRKVFLIHVPYIFLTAWKIIYPFIDKNTRKRIVFVENKNQQSVLLNEIDESQLPEIYGGKLPLIPIQDSSY